MTISNVNRVFFLGIGGIGMSALARYFKKQGAKVSGYDKTQSELTDALNNEGIKVHFNTSVEHVDANADLFVYTPAIPISHPAFEYIRSIGGKWLKRSEVLQSITSQSQTLAISGTHGKTTTSAFLTHILHECHGKISGFVGGIMTNYNSNLVASEKSEFIVVEADEYDKSFLRLKPKVAVVTSLDPDHLDVYGTFEQMKDDYQSFVSSSELVLVNERVASEFQHANKRTYGQNEQSDYRAENVHVDHGRFIFSVKNGRQSLGEFRSQLPGRHNVENALAAISICAELGLDMDAVRSAVSSFKGVHRRFDVVFESESVRIIDDYAHHPIEIKAAIDAARELFPASKVTVVFQPHLYSRTRDLENDFAESLSGADEVLLLPIYPAREEPIDGVSSANLLKKLTLKTKHLVEKTDLVNDVLSLSPETVLMLGAGDIDRLVKPLVTALKALNDVE